jgi:hypothetical protein
MSMTSMGPIEKFTYSNEKFKTLRNNMLNGVWDEIGCESCFFKEKHGLNSQITKWLNISEKLDYMKKIKILIETVYIIYT